MNEEILTHGTQEAPTITGTDVCNSTSGNPVTWMKRVLDNADQLEVQDYTIHENSNVTIEYYYGDSEIHETLLTAGIWLNAMSRLNLIWDYDVTDEGAFAELEDVGSIQVPSEEAIHFLGLDNNLIKAVLIYCAANLTRMPLSEIKKPTECVDAFLTGIRENSDARFSMVEPKNGSKHMTEQQSEAIGDEIYRKFSNGESLFESFASFCKPV